MPEEEEDEAVDGGQFIIRLLQCDCQCAVLMSLAKRRAQAHPQSHMIICKSSFGFDWRLLISRTGNERGTIAEGGGIELSLACVKQ